MFQYTKAQRLRASTAVRKAIQNGDLIHPTFEICVNCHEQAEEYHHWPYEEQYFLAVEPMCTSCHVGYHARLRAQKRRTVEFTISLGRIKLKSVLNIG